MAERKAGRSDRRQHGKSRKWITLQEASDTFWEGRKDISPSYRANAERAIAMHLATIGDRDIASITRDDLLTVLRVMDAAGLHVYVRKVRMWIGQVWDWAVENGHASSNTARLINPEKAFGRAPVQNFAALTLREMATSGSGKRPARIQRRTDSLVTCMSSISSERKITRSGVSVVIIRRYDLR